MKKEKEKITHTESDQCHRESKWSVNILGGWLSFDQLI